MNTKYELPHFLQGRFEHKDYVTWLRRKAQNLANRDKDRWKQDVSKAAYMQAIHDAVLRSEGRDAYTHEMLDWSLLRQYDNEESQRRGSSYKRQFALLPTVDHADPGSRQPDFRICGWRTNDWKSDLTLEELRELCQKFLEAQGTSS